MSKRCPLLAALSATVLAGCGNSSSNRVPVASSLSRHATSQTAGPSAAGGSTSPPAGAALTAEARSAATGDIPDQQVYLTFTSPHGHFSMLYPEGWAVQGSGDRVSFVKTNNVVRVLIARAAAPTATSVTAELDRERAGQPSLHYGTAGALALGGGRAVKIGYSTLSAANPVTGRQVKLLVDRYVLARAGRSATIDLGTPTGVDNVDAYKKIANSFRWK